MSKAEINCHLVYFAIMTAAGLTLRSMDGGPSWQGLFLIGLIAAAWFTGKQMGKQKANAVPRPSNHEQTAKAYGKQRA